MWADDVEAERGGQCLCGFWVVLLDVALSKTKCAVRVLCSGFDLCQAALPPEHISGGVRHGRESAHEFFFMSLTLVSTRHGIGVELPALDGGTKIVYLTRDLSHGDCQGRDHGNHELQRFIGHRRASSLCLRGVITRGEGVEEHTVDSGSGSVQGPGATDQLVDLRTNPVGRSGLTEEALHFTPAERAARGRAARRELPRSAHAAWEPTPMRRDPIALLEQQAQTRLLELVPIRYGRMLVSPFTFFRGAAYLMAADLADGPRTGIYAQLCGDAHLSNYGFFATPERRLVFDMNYFDRAVPGAGEWDVKRLATSFVLAGLGPPSGRSRSELEWLSALLCVPPDLLSPRLCQGGSIPQRLLC